MVTEKLKIRYIDFHQIPQICGKKFLLVFRAKEIKEFLRAWDIPLAPNLREPKKNFVTEGIVKDIRSGALKSLPDSLHVFVSDVYAHNGCAYLDFGGELFRSAQLYGFLNGGHRLLAFHNALMAGLEIDDIEIKLEVYQDYTFHEIQKIAIALNKSKQVKISSIVNHGGGFEWLKPHLEGLNIRYYENEAGTPDSHYCSVERVVWLLSLLNTEYNPSSSHQQAHPTVLGNSQHALKRHSIEDQPAKYAHLARACVELQTLIALEWNRRQNRTRSTNLRFIEIPKNPNQCTQLPTGEKLACKLPSRAFIAPILSAFRAFLDGGDKPKWIHGASWEQVKAIAKDALIPEMVDRYIKELRKPSWMARTIASIACDFKLWTIMYNIVQEAQDALEEEIFITRSAIVQKAVEADHAQAIRAFEKQIGIEISVKSN
jgi:hypothetical protein